MKVVVASRNPVKIRAVCSAFEQHFQNLQIDVIGIDADSGVGDQPMTDGETRAGAKKRAENACEKQPEAAYWVGLEGGTELVDGSLMAFAWMAIRGLHGEVSEARTVTLPLPPAVKELVESGLELGDANDRVFSTANSKQAGGAYGLLSNGRYTRESVYTEALSLALIPFVNDLYK